MHEGGGHLLRVRQAQWHVGRHGTFVTPDHGRDPSQLASTGLVIAEVWGGEAEVQLVNWSGILLGAASASYVGLLVAAQASGATILPGSIPPRVYNLLN
jgi:hypothetical protein